MKRHVAGGLAIFFSMSLLVACGDDSGTGVSTQSGMDPSSFTVPADAAPTVPFGTTQEIRSEGFAIGLSDYTVSAPRMESGAYVVDLTIATKQGECIPGSFFVLTEQGNKVEALDASGPGVFDKSGTLIAGERRTGTLTFQVPSGDRPTKFILYHGTMNPPVAYWTAN